ncbi:EAL domain-containing protein [Candidatus Hydrogenisulfobacillus filiaventi]|uniref:EAL domain-containing protein n=1 Tax=Candidatus Hydrogenisulfobacillus filiaventi TaxID=2707344 RepID=A0A6F8ZII5_9FIRM|nr:EAL domain-containing protein [Candidatus Hydrogenisulfobacillus filiaventi]
MTTPSAPIRLAYWLQPIVALETGAIIGREWLTRGAGETSAAQLWSWAARTGRVAALEWQVLEDIRRWRRQLPPEPVWVNLHPDGVAALAQWDPVAARAGLAPVVWEILELAGWATNLIERVAGSAPVALDDWGESVGTTTRLTTWPVQWVKLDAGLVWQAPVRFGLGRWLQLVRGFAQDRGIRLVAEGVETQAQYAVAKELGFFAAQGFAIARPTQWAEVEWHPPPPSLPPRAWRAERDRR